MIFIFGSNGFIGSAIVRYCQLNGVEFQAITRQNYSEFEGKSCEIFINANGNSKKYLAEEQPLAEFDASVRSVRASLEDFQFDHYVYLSSCDVYPDCSSSVFTKEDMLLDITRQSPYGFHKYLAELCVHNKAKKWLIVRMGGFVGPGLKKNPIYDILHGGPLRLDPASELQYLHTDSFTRILFDLMKIDIEDQIINVCGEGTVSLEDVISQAGRDVPVMPGSPKVRYEVSIDRLRSLVLVPESRQTVLDFVKTEINRIGS